MSVPRTVYVETSVISYLTAWPSKETVRAAQQELTKEWWDTQRQQFELYTSQFVILEASHGDENAAAERLAVLAQLHALDVTDAATALGNQLLAATPLPAKAAGDALHIAIAAVNGLDYLITWNCRHLANAIISPAVERVCREQGYEPPVICMPHQLREVEP